MDHDPDLEQFDQPVFDSRTGRWPVLRIVDSIRAAVDGEDRHNMPPVRDDLDQWAG